MGKSVGVFTKAPVSKKTRIISIAFYSHKFGSPVAPSYEETGLVGLGIGI